MKIKALSIALLLSFSAGCYLIKGKSSRLSTLKVDVPRNVVHAEDDPGIQDESAVMISIPMNGLFYLGDKELTEPNHEFSIRIQEALQKQAGSNKIVYLAAGSRVDYQSVADALRQISKAGANRIGLVVRQSEAATPQRLLVSIPFEPDIFEDLAGLEKAATPQLAAYVEPSNQLTLRRPLMYSDSASGKLYLFGPRAGAPEETFSDMTALSQKLPTLFQETNDKILIIRGRRSSQYSEIVRLVDAAKGAGANQVVLQFYDLP